MSRIALFGTSADPPTTGHQQILNWLSHQFDQVAVWASNNPFKSHQTPLEHRFRMLGLLIDEIDPPRQNIHLVPELSHPRSLDTVETARRLWGPSAQFTLVIGADLITQLPRWYRVKDLLHQVELLIVPRPGYVIEEADLNQLRDLGGKIAIANLTGLAVSSTAYRHSKDPHALTSPVEDYIQQKRLYECQDAPSRTLQIR